MKTAQPTAMHEFDPDVAPGAALGTIAARSSLAVGVAKALRYGFVLIVHVVLMNILRPADFGLVRYVTVILGLLGLISEAGLSVAVVQKKEVDSGELGAVFTMNLLLGAALYGIIWFAAPLAASFFQAPLLTPLVRAGALSLPLGGASVVHRALLQRRFRYSRLALIEVAGAVAGSFTSLLMALNGMGVWSLVWGTVVFHVCGTALFFAGGPWFSGYFSGFRRTTPLFVFGLSVVAQRLIDYCTSNADYVIVGKMFGAAVLGMYGVAYDIVTMPQLALGVVLAGVALSAFSRFQDDDTRMRESFLRLTLVVSIAATPFLVFAGAMAGELMKVVTFLKPSDTWLPAAGPVRILSFMGILYCYTSYPGVIWIAKGKIRLRIYWILFSFVTVVAAVLAGSAFGILGVCKALLVRAFVLFPVILVIMKRVIDLAPSRYMQALLPSACCGAVMLGVLWAVKTALPGDSTGASSARLAVAALAGAGTYTAVCALVFRQSWGTLTGYGKNLFGRSGNAG
jgi:PST family polysaccharide transporter